MMMVTGTSRARASAVIGVDLVVVAVDERDPGAGMVGVAALGFGEDLGDHAGRALDHAGE